MRAGPIGVLPTVDDVVHHAAVQARITHDTPSGVEAAQAAALALHYCYHQLGPKAAVGDWIDRHLRSRGGHGGWSQPFIGPVGAQGQMSVRAALTALASCDSLSALLRACIAYTGDVDTVATIALAAGSVSTEVTQDLPAVLFATLEDGAYGRSYLHQLDKRLITRHPPAMS